MSDSSLHRTHPEILRRLRRAEGHLKTVLAMLEGGRSCVEIAQQLHAVEKAIGSAKKTLIYDHIDHCLEAGVGTTAGGARAAIAEFQEIAKYL